MTRLKGLFAKMTVDHYRRVLDNKGYAFFEKGSFNLNIIGVRNSSGRADTFDDFINIIYKIQDEWVVDSYEVTTDPGPHILRRPINKKGTAILVPDQYRGVYKIGTHKTYTAIVQRNGPVKVWRDDNRDSEPDCVGPEDEGFYGINIHKHSGPNNRTTTGGSSAGCQVFRSSKDFYEFMDTCDIAAEKWKNKFTYTLLDETDLNSCLIT